MAVNPRPDELAGRLVDAAATLLASGGPAALSLRRVATAAGTSTMAVYTRFGDKAGLLAAMHRLGFARLGSALRAAAAASQAGGGSALDALGATGEAYRDAALAGPHLYQLLFGPPVEGLEPDEGGLAAADAAYAALVDAVAACVAENSVAGDPAEVAGHLWAVSHGMVSLELGGHLPAGPDPALRYREALVLAVAPWRT